MHGYTFKLYDYIYAWLYMYTAICMKFYANRTNSPNVPICIASYIYVYMCNYYHRDDVDVCV